MKKFSTGAFAAAAVATSLSAAPAMSATVFSNDTANLDIIGRMKINYFNNDADQTRHLVGTARFGVQGNTNVNEYISVFGKLLYDVHAQEVPNEQRFKIRYGFVGFDFNDYGKISVGRFEDAYYKVTAPTDIYVDWGDNGVTFWGLTDNDYGGRTDGQIMYDVNHNGWLLSLSYRFRDRNKHVKYAVAGTTGYEFDFGANANPLGLMFGMNHIEGDGDRNLTSSGYLTGMDKDELAVSAYWGSFGAPGFYAAAVYNQGKLKETYKTRGFEATLAYTTPGKSWTFSSTYGYLKNRDGNLAVGDSHSALSKALSGEIIYDLTSNFRIYAEYEHHWESILDKDDKDKFTFGLIYNF